ncbi:MAG TPA: DUF3267 domain-containing protein [Bacteroidota bacterium]|nr:DUF3267 domain-containing protein [Bacteroidota bacterium]
MDLEQQSITPTRLLPDSYKRIWGLDLATDRTTALVLNLISLPLFVVAGWLFLRAASLLNPGITAANFVRILSVRPLVAYSGLVAVLVGTTLLHELIHGLFFWLTTRTKPVFGLKLLFAYAGAPEWYIPRNQYSVIGLAPFVMISLCGFLLIPLTPVVAGQLILFGMVVNAAGAIGDLYVCGRVLRLPLDVLIRDTGYVFDVYGKAV